jgi:hypothetical protein
MSIFDLHAAVLADYRDFVCSFFIGADERARQFVELARVTEARSANYLRARNWPQQCLAYCRIALRNFAAIRWRAGSNESLVWRRKQGCDSSAACHAPSYKRLGLTTADYAPFLKTLLALLVSQGLLVRLGPLDDHQFYQLDAACLLWRLGDSSPWPPDPIYSRRTYARLATPVNVFFQRFYRDSAAALAALEAREHTTCCKLTPPVRKVTFIPTAI